MSVFFDASVTALFVCLEIRRRASFPDTIPSAGIYAPHQDIALPAASLFLKNDARLIARSRSHA